jgi:hypothetical protein
MVQANEETDVLHSTLGQRKEKNRLFLRFFGFRARVAQQVIAMKFSAEPLASSDNYFSN